MKLEELKQGQQFFCVSADNIVKYEYLMLYPFHNPENVKVKGYHIILNKNLDEPKRVYYTELERMISQNITSYEEAKKMQIRLIEEHLNYLKNR